MCFNFFISEWKKLNSEIYLEDEQLQKKHVRALGTLALH